MSSALTVALPFWLDRADREAVEIAAAAESAGFDAVWVGEMATFDAFALATAIGLATERIRLTIGPLAIGVRSPVQIALGVSTVVTLTGRDVDVSLGASSPAIVSGWHERPWTALATSMSGAVASLRAILDGERVRGFRLRAPQRSCSIAVAAFGPAMTGVAARQGDTVVLNLVPPERVAAARRRIDRLAAAAGRPCRPRLAVWVPAALDPGPAARAQLAGQLAVYLAPPGYGELFASLGFGELVALARAGAPRAELAEAIPLQLAAAVGAIGSADAIRLRIAAYREAGADEIAVVPSTAEDVAGRRVLELIASAAAGR